MAVTLDTSSGWLLCVFPWVEGNCEILSDRFAADVIGPRGFPGGGCWAAVELAEVSGALWGRRGGGWFVGCVFDGAGIEDTGARRGVGSGPDRTLVLGCGTELTSMRDREIEAGSNII